MPTTRWEYRVIGVVPGLLQCALDEQARQGWELVDVQREGELDRLVLKRPCQGRKGPD